MNIDFNEIFTSKNSGPFKIIKDLGKIKPGSDYYYVKIKFLDDNIFGIDNCQVVSTYSIRNKSVVDNYMLTMFNGNGCKGMQIHLWMVKGKKNIHYGAA